MLLDLYHFSFQFSRPEGIGQQEASIGGDSEWVTVKIPSDKGE